MERYGGISAKMRDGETERQRDGEIEEGERRAVGGDRGGQRGRQREKRKER